MKQPNPALSLAAILLATLAFAPLASAASDPVPCEEMVPQVNAALRNAKLSDADKAKVLELKKSGLAKCKLEKDAEADADFTATLKIMGK
jgi:hypothetical protein